MMAVVGLLMVGLLAAASRVEVVANPTNPELLFATSEIAQVLLSIAAVSFAVLSARAYGGEIGNAIYVAGAGVIIFGTWQLVHAAAGLLALDRPPAAADSSVYLMVTILLLAGFYMLYETMHRHSAG
jgi:hypothetical protein